MPYYVCDHRKSCDCTQADCIHHDTHKLRMVISNLCNHESYCPEVGETTRCRKSTSSFGRTE